MTSYERQMSLGAARRPLSRTTNSPTAFMRDPPTLRQQESPGQYEGAEVARKRRQVVDRTSLEEANGATPVAKPFLSSNVTPRSGSRRIRAETSSPLQSPRSNGVRASPRSTLSVDKRLAQEPTLRGRSDIAGESPRSVQKHEPGGLAGTESEATFTFRSSSLYGTDTASSAPLADDGPKFFHADEIQPSKRSRPASVTGTSKLLQQGHHVGEEPSGRSSAMSNGSAARNEQQSAFFYADDSPQIKSSPQMRANGASSTRPTLQTIHSQQIPAAISPVRDPSPLREEILPRRSSLTNASPRKHKRLSSGNGIDMQSASIAMPTSTSVSRRSSLNSPSSKRDSTRARASSVHASNPTYARDEASRVMDDDLMDGSSAILPQWYIDSFYLLQRHLETLVLCTSVLTSLFRNHSSTPHPVSLPPKSEMTLTSPLRSQPQSPTRFPQSRIDEMNELAANARRERKVMDLEISNSSLLAINQTLEREMRKHKAELRRYRRLDRNGRLSTAPSSRSVSGKLSMLADGMSGLDLDEMSSSDDSDDDSLGKDDSSAFMTSIGSRPSSPTSRIPDSRFHDLIVPPLDLSAQRSLLEESQKLNQSIKRCLGRTESLLASAKGALESGLNMPDDKPLGARVLSPEELEEDADNRRQGLLSPSQVENVDTENPWERSFAQNINPIGAAGAPSELGSILSKYTGESGPTAEGQLENGHGRETRHHSNDEITAGSIKDGDHGGATKNSLSERSVSLVDPHPDDSETSVSFGRSPSISSDSHHTPATVPPLTLQADLTKEPFLRSNPVRSPSIFSSNEQSEEAIDSSTVDDIQLSSVDPRLTHPEPPNSSGSLAKDSTLPSESANGDLGHRRNVDQNTPGNRGSLQNIGNYLSSWSKFAAGIRPP